MKSNQERSNECLPPKKREILALEEKQVLVSAAVTESQSGENLAWLASVASMASMAHVPSNGDPSHSVSAEPDRSDYPPVTTSTALSFSSSGSNNTYRGVFSGPTMLTANSAVLSTSLPHTIGSVQYTHLPQNLQLIGPYTSYISSQIVPSTACPKQPRKTTQDILATTAANTQASQYPIDSQSQHVISSVSNVSHSQCIQVESAPMGLTVSSSSTQLPIQIHPHSAVIAPHGLALTPSQVVLHYTDGYLAKQQDSHPREVHNGPPGDVTVVKQSTSMGKGIPCKTDIDQNHKQAHNLGLQSPAPVLLPAEYGHHDRAGLQASLMLVSSSQLATNSSTEVQSILGKDHPSLHLAERGGILIGKSLSRVPTLTSSDSQVSLTPTLSPHTVLQTPNNPAQQEITTSLYSATQLPIIGYITSAAGGTHQTVASYQSNLPQHVVISGNPSLLIPVSATNISPSTAEPDVSRGSIIPSVAKASTILPQNFINTPSPMAPVLPNGKDVGGSAGIHVSGAIQSQVQLPVLSTTAVGSTVSTSAPTSTASHGSPSSQSAALPPFFMKGSIIQLADGELKRVEDLRTEDFVQSAELSGELRIDSSTVERIEHSRTPNAVIIQFSVGENKAQVCVEVLVEYPFFVFGQGWSSCSPDRTTQLLALSCAKLSVGDVCISLTLKSVKNNTQVKDHFSEHMVKHIVPTAQNNGVVEERPTLKENLKRGLKIASGEGIGLLGALVKTPNLVNLFTLPENGHKNSQSQAPIEKTQGSTEERAVSRKRRWSAPEKREMSKSQEDSQNFPKVPFLPHQLKVSIEGHSSAGC